MGKLGVYLKVWKMYITYREIKLITLLDKKQLPKHFRYRFSFVFFRLSFVFLKIGAYSYWYISSEYISSPGLKVKKMNSRTIKGGHYKTSSAHILFSLYLGGSRDNNFEDPIQLDQDRRETRYGQRRFYNDHPLHSLLNL